jgi:hypothetical protein
MSKRIQRRIRRDEPTEVRSPGMQAAAAGLDSTPYLHPSWGGEQPWPVTPPADPPEPLQRTEERRRSRRNGGARVTPWPAPPAPVIPPAAPVPAWAAALRGGADCVGPGAGWFDTWDGDDE